MKGLESLIRVRSWELDQKRKALVDLQSQQEAIAQRQQALEDEIESEKKKAAEDVHIGMAFSAYHAAAVKKRAQLQAEFDAMLPMIEQARDEMAEAFQAAKQFEILQENIDAQEAQEQAAQETSEMDEIGLNLHRRSDTKT